MNDLYTQITFTLIIYSCILIQIFFYRQKSILSKQYIKFWFENNVVLTETNKITRTSDLFNNYCIFTRIKNNKKQDLILFGKLFKSFIKEEGIPLTYKKGRFAGYTNIKALI